MRRQALLAPAISTALAAGALTLAPPAQAAQLARADEQGGPNTYYSAPPAALLGRTATPQGPAKRPKAPKTKGTITGQVVGPQGRPIKGALVTAVRFSDLGLPIDTTVEKRLVARTGRTGGFSLKQLREPYLVRVCSPVKGADECDQDSSKRFTPTYLGPDGNLNSWMRHTRMFEPQLPKRNLGRVVVQPSAVVTGTWKKDGAERTVYLTRIDGSITAATTTDRKGNYRFKVAPGPYRLEVDHDEGLRTDATVPGYQSRRFVVRAGRTHRDDFSSRHAGIIRGLVTSNGVPLANEFLAILDSTGAFAAGVTTNEIGRYVISSLKPGSYTVTTSYASSNYVPAAKPVTVTQKDVATADLALDAGRGVSFIPSDSIVPGANGSVDAELRTADNRVVKTFQGNPATLPGGTVTFTGLPAGFYTLYVRRSAIPAAVEQTEFPWKSQVVDLNSAPTAILGLVTLDQPTRNLTGTLPVGAQLKLTARPADAWLVPAYVDGDQATPMAVNWTVGETGGQYVVRGVVPGTYAAAVTTRRLEPVEGPSTTGGNWATTHSTVIVDGPAPVIPFTAPAGATVRAKLRYAASGRPAIAPVGLTVNDPGDQSWLFPTVAGPQRFAKPVKVQRLHAGQVAVKVLDLDALFAEHLDVLIPETLVSSAHSEPGTSYWFTGSQNGVDVTAGATTNVGIVKLKLHGVLGVRASIGFRE